MEISEPHDADHGTSLFEYVETICKAVVTLTLVLVAYQSFP